MTSDAWIVVSHAARELSTAADAMAEACRANFARGERGESYKPVSAVKVLKAWQTFAIAYLDCKVPGSLGVASAPEPVAPVDAGTAGLGSPKR